MQKLSVLRLPRQKRLLRWLHSIPGEGYNGLCSQHLLIPTGNDLKPMLFSEGQSLGHLARGSTLARQGDTVLHAVVCASRKNECKDRFLQLVVDYKYRSYAGGDVPNNKKRRELNNMEEDILIARIIDRSLRPLFPEGYLNDLQLTVTLHAFDSIHDPIPLAVNAAAIALIQSKIPWNGPLACVRVCRLKGGDGGLIVNPSIEQMENAELDILYAGTSFNTLMCNS